MVALPVALAVALALRVRLPVTVPLALPVAVAQWHCQWLRQCDCQCHLQWPSGCHGAALAVTASGSKLETFVCVWTYVYPRRAFRVLLMMQPEAATAVAVRVSQLEVDPPA